MDVALQRVRDINIHNNKAGENKYLPTFFTIIEILQFFIIYDKKKRKKKRNTKLTTVLWARFRKRKKRREKKKHSYDGLQID